MRKYVDRVLSTFEVNLVPIIIVVVSSFALFAPDQFREIYRGFAQRVAALGTVPSWTSYPEFWNILAVFGYILVSLTLLCVLVWLTCRANFGEAEEPASKVVLLLRKLISLGLAIAPFLLLAFGLYAASIDRDKVNGIKDLLAAIKELDFKQVQVEAVDPNLAHDAALGWAAQIVRYNDILIGLAILFAVLGVLLVIALNRLEHSARAKVMGRVIMSGPFVLGAFAIFLALAIVYTEESGDIATHISAVPILLVFAALGLIVGNYLTVQSGSIGRLATWALVIVAIVFSLFEFTDNHSVRRVADAKPAEPVAPELSDIFSTWFNARTDRSKFPDRYPVYVVAAQGGGIYAAMHAATFLSYMQQRCPNFAHHLFGISGVSGGSVGAAVFAASMREAEHHNAITIPDKGCNPAGSTNGPALLDVATEVLGNDFWSSLQAMWLFPDLLQRFLPVRIERFDRARALEHRLEASWDRMITKSDLFGSKETVPPNMTAPPPNIMAEPFGSLWPQGFDKSLFTPALVLNTTEVDSGQRRLIAPFKFEGLSKPKILPIHCVTGGVEQADKIKSIPLSTAAVLSARFPWITPTAWYYEPPKNSDVGECNPIKSGEITKVSDGGYFESSGVATALDLTRSLQKLSEQLKLRIDIQLIVLTTVSTTISTSGSVAPEPVGGLNEVLDPIRAMLNAREARGSIEIDRAVAAAGGGTVLSAPPEDGSSRVTVLKVVLDDVGYPLPLGWSLSTVTRSLIQFQTGEFGPCESQQGLRAQTTDVHSSSCVIGDIVKQLSYR